MQIRFTEKDLEGSSYIPEGEHEVTVAEVKSDTSKAGNAMVVVTVKDRMGREAREFFPLSDNAKWKLAQFALATGLDKAALSASGLNVPQLVGRKLLVVKKQSGVAQKDGKEVKQYSMEFFKIPGSSTSSGSRASDEDIPF